MASDFDKRLRAVPVEFACCGTKDKAKNCVCIACDSIYHISCSERRKFICFGSATGICQCRYDITSNQATDQKIDVTDKPHFNILKEKIATLTLDNIRLTEKSDEREIELIKQINELKAELHTTQNSIDSKEDEINKYKNLCKQNSAELKSAREKLKLFQEELKEAQANLKAKESNPTSSNYNSKDYKDNTADELTIDNTKTSNYQDKGNYLERIKILNELNETLKENNKLSKAS